MRHQVNLVEDEKFIKYMLEEGIMTNAKLKYEKIGWNTLIVYGSGLTAGTYFGTSSKLGE